MVKATHLSHSQVLASKIKQVHWSYSILSSLLRVKLNKSITPTKSKTYTLSCIVIHIFVIWTVLLVCFQDQHIVHVYVRRCNEFLYVLVKLMVHVHAQPFQHYCGQVYLANHLFKMSVYCACDIQNLIADDSFRCFFCEGIICVSRLLNLLMIIPLIVYDNIIGSECCDTVMQFTYLCFPGFPVSVASLQLTIFPKASNTLQNKINCFNHHRKRHWKNKFTIQVKGILIWKAFFIKSCSIQLKIQKSNTAQETHSTA